MGYNNRRQTYRVVNRNIGRGTAALKKLGKRVQAFKRGAQFTAAAGLTAGNYLFKKKTPTPAFKKTAAYNQNGHTADYSIIGGRYGKKKTPHNFKQIKKVVEAAQEYTIEGLRSYTTMFGVQGAQALSCQMTGSNLSAPIVLYDLTASFNTSNAVTATPETSFRLSFDNSNDTGNALWDNANYGTFAFERASLSNGYTDIKPQGKCLFDWASVKALCYAPTAMPTRWTFQLIQFKDVRLVPNALTTTFASAFWQAQTKKLIKSPLEPGSSTWDKYFRVLKKITFIQDPKESVETSAARYKQVNLFARFNRMCSYQWDDTDRMGLLTDNEGQINMGTQNRTTVHPRARIYLMITAMAKVANQYDGTVHPSFDIVIRKKNVLTSM